jgi:CRISPR-associated protein Cas2
MVTFAIRHSPFAIRMKCLLTYDIPHDGTRTKIADFCLDYGLDRIQYSAFVGDLTRTYQEELMLKIGDRLGDRPGKIQLFAICDKDWRQRIEIIQERDDDGE